jgi:hypothetical protein
LPLLHITNGHSTETEKKNFQWQAIKQKKESFKVNCNSMTKTKKEKKKSN